MDEKITVCTVNFNSADFIEIILYCLKRTTKNSYRVIIRDNNSKLDDYKKLEKIIRDFDNVYLYRIDRFNLKGSLAHGTALNDLVQHIKSPYGVILDSDCTFLHQNWDEILIKEIDKTHPIIGTQTIEHPESKKFLDFPFMFAVMFDNKIMQELEIDFRPERDLAKDTGHKLRESYQSNGYKGKLISIKSTRDFKSGPFKDIICAEYYLKGHDNIFACHFGRGSSLGRAKYNKGWKRFIYSIPYFGKRLLRHKGKKEKRKWIKICQEIVDKE